MSDGAALLGYDMPGFPQKASGPNRIVLYGALAEQFGAEHRYVVGSPREALRALVVNKPGFAEAVAPIYLRVVRTKPGSGVELALDETDIHMPMSADTELHVTPLAIGSGEGKSGLGKILAGVIVVAAAVFTAGAAAPGLALFGANGALAASTALGISYGTFAMFGMSMALGGLAMMLAPQPDAVDPQKNDESHLLSQITNTQSQGVAEPLPFGRVRTGSVVISSSVADEQVDVGAGAYPGSGTYITPGEADPWLLAPTDPDEQLQEFIDRIAD